MKVFESLEEIINIEDTVVALGNFDGVHLGHQEIINRTVRSAEAAGLASAVFTFSNHTSTVLNAANPVKNILFEIHPVFSLSELMNLSSVLLPP